MKHRFFFFFSEISTATFGIKCIFFFNIQIRKYFRFFQSLVLLKNLWMHDKNEYLLRFTDGEGNCYFWSWAKMMHGFFLMKC